MSREDLRELERLADSIQTATSPREAAQFAAQMRALAERTEQEQRQKHQDMRRDNPVRV